MEPVRHILPSAQIQLTLGTAFIAQLQGVYGFLLEGHDKSEGETIRTKVQNKEPLTSWEQSLMTLTALIQAIHNKAVEQGDVEYKSISDTLTQLS